MLIFLFLFSYGAFSPSPDKDFYRRTVWGAEGINGSAASPEADFRQSLVGMRRTIEAQRNQEQAIIQQLQSLSLQKQAIETELATAEEKAERLFEVEARLAEVTEMLTQKETLLETVQTKKRETEISLDRHREKEVELEGQIADQKDKLKRSKTAVRILTGQNAISDVTTETYVSEVQTFLRMVGEIIKVYKETEVDCQLLERAVTAFEKDSNFTFLAKEVKTNYAQEEETTTHLFTQKKMAIQQALSQILDQVLTA